MPDLPRVTVATIVSRNNQYLMVEEFDNGELVLNQPTGHVEPGERLFDAAVRETEEKTGWRVTLKHLVGIFQHTSPLDSITYTRLAFAAVPVEQLNIAIDPDIAAVHWLEKSEILARSLRSPMVMACIEADESGVRLPLSAVRHL